jgi:hypothetical protein
MSKLTHQEIIIKALAGASSTNPMTATELNSVAGPKINNLDAFYDVCEQLYQSRIINRCLQTKHGLEQYLYWPTANVNNKAPVFIISNKRHLDATLTPSPRRTESYKPVVTTNKDESTMSKSPKYPATLIVLAVADHPNIHFNDLIAKLIGESKDDHNQARDMVYYCIKSRFIAKDGHKQLTLGDNDAWLIKNGFFDTKLASPRVADNTATNFLKEPHVTKSANIITELHLPSAEKSIEIEAIKTTDHLADYLQAENINADLHAKVISSEIAEIANITYCINKLFDLLPPNVGMGITKLADGNMHINVALHEKTYLPKVDQVESCLNAIKTLTQFEVA